MREHTKNEKTGKSVVVFIHISEIVKILKLLHITTYIQSLLSLCIIILVCTGVPSILVEVIICEKV